MNDIYEEASQGYDVGRSLPLWETIPDLFHAEESELQMSVNSIKALAEQVGVPEIIPHLDQCGESILMEVDDLLRSLVAIQGHPSPAYRAHVRAGLLDDIWDRIFGFDQADYLRWLILNRIEQRVRVRGLHDLNLELWVLANLWDTADSKENLDEECEAMEGYDQVCLEETYLQFVPSPDAVMHTAGRAIYYVANGNMSGTVPTHEAVEYFGWEI